MTPPKETWKTSDATNIPIEETVHNNEILIHSLNKEALRVKVELPELHSTDPQIKKLSEYQYTNDIGKLSEGENLTFVFQIKKENINQNDNLQSVANTGEIKEKKRDFKCHVCGKCLSRKDSLKNHILLMHPELKRFVCQTCGRSYVLKADFEKHSETHMTKYFKCEVCGKEFTLKTRLKTHMASHNGLRPFVCTECGLSFAFKGSLNSHINDIHKGIKKHECNECGARFTRLSSLKSHIDVQHKKLKPFRCQECGMRFTQMSSCKRHAAAHGGIEKFECAECGNSFTQKGSLKRHMLSHHNML